MSYYLTTGSNLRLYFHYPEGIQENGTLHVYGYKNARMEGFPIAKLEIPNFDLQKCHPSIYGSHYIETGISYTGNSWWFAWVDTSPDSESYLGWTPNPHGEGGSAPYGGIARVTTDLSSMAYGQSGLSGITLTTGLNKIFFTLQDFFAIEGFPQFGWKNENKINVDKYIVLFTRYSGTNTAQIPSTELIDIRLDRPFFCAQDLLYPPSSLNIKYFNNQTSGVGLLGSTTYQIFGYTVYTSDSSMRKNNINTLKTYTNNLPSISNNWIGSKLFSTQYHTYYRTNFSPTYSIPVPSGYPTGWNNFGE